MGNRSHLVLGTAGEDAVSKRYVELGYRVVARNWRCSFGELDLILLRGDLLVICEVKTRRGRAFGGGFEAVTPVKRRRLRRLADAYLLMSDVAAHERVRFDVASVLATRGSLELQLFEDAF